MTLSKTLKIVIVISFIFLAISWNKKSVLPDSFQISSELKQDPIQREVDLEPFFFPYMGTTYVIEPEAEYELWGLVVTHNNTRGWADIYHDNSSVDIKDLCVIWGDNLENNIHHSMKFSSNTWTCYYQADSRSTHELFNGLQLSNNHLLSPNSNMREEIFKASVGDQVHLKGMLVNYYPKGSPEYVRSTSLVRSDTGNGACEVVFVEEIDILKKGNAIWHRIFKISKACLLIAILMFFVNFLLCVYREQGRLINDIAALKRKRKTR